MLLPTPLQGGCLRKKSYSKDDREAVVLRVIDQSRRIVDVATNQRDRGSRGNIIELGSS